MLKFQGLAKHFIQTKAHEKDNYNIIILERNPDIPKTKIERDSNSTQIEARHCLATNVLRIKQGIEHYRIKFSPIEFPSAISIQV